MPGHHTDTSVRKNVNEGDNDAVNQWRRSVRRWTLVPWLLLTVGIFRLGFSHALWGLSNHGSKARLPQPTRSSPRTCGASAHACGRARMIPPTLLQQRLQQVRFQAGDLATDFLEHLFPGQ